MEARVAGIRFVIESKLEDVIALTEIVATEVVRVKPSNEYWHIYQYLEALLRTKQCKDAVEKGFREKNDAALIQQQTSSEDVQYMDVGMQSSKRCLLDCGTFPGQDDTASTDSELAFIKFQKANNRTRSLQLGMAHDGMDQGLASQRADELQPEQATRKLEKALRAYRRHSVPVPATSDQGVLGDEPDEWLQQQQAAITIQKAFRAHRSHSVQAMPGEAGNEGFAQQDDLLEQQQAAIKIQQAFRQSRLNKYTPEYHLLQIAENEEDTEATTASCSSLHATNQKASPRRVSVMSSWLSDLAVRRKTMTNAVPSPAGHPPRRQTWSTRESKKICVPFDSKQTGTFQSGASDPDVSPVTRSSAPRASQNHAEAPQPMLGVSGVSLSASNGISRASLLRKQRFSPQTHIAGLNSCLTVDPMTISNVVTEPSHVKQANRKNYSKSVDLINLKAKDEGKKKKVPPAPPSSPRSSVNGRSDKN